MSLHAQKKGKYVMTKYSISHFQANYHFKDLEAVPLSFYIRKRPIFFLCGMPFPLTSTSETSCRGNSTHVQPPF